MVTAMGIRTAVAPLAEVLPLRWEILRPGLPRESAEFAEDVQPGAFHIAAYGDDVDTEGALAVYGCGSFYPEGFPGRGELSAERSVRIRGMASSARVRGQGYGTAVLEAGTHEALSRGARLMWCNGRTGARGFYERHGYTVHGEEFEIEGVGPHFVFYRALD